MDQDSQHSSSDSLWLNDPLVNKKLNSSERLASLRDDLGYSKLDGRMISDRRPLESVRSLDLADLYDAKVSTK